MLDHLDETNHAKELPGNEDWDQPEYINLEI